MPDECNNTIKKSNNTVKKNNNDPVNKNYSFLKVRLRAEDIDLCKSRAKECELTMAEYMRRVISNTPLNVRELNAYARSLIYEIQKIGNNINQIAKAVNTDGQLSKSDRQYLLSMVARLTDLAMDAIKAVKGDTDGDK